MSASLYPPSGVCPLWRLLWPSVARLRRSEGIIPPRIKSAPMALKTPNRGYADFAHVPGALAAVFWGLTVSRSRLCPSVQLPALAALACVPGSHAGPCSTLPGSHAGGCVSGPLWLPVAALAAGPCSYTPTHGKAPYRPPQRPTEGKRKTAPIGRLPIVIYCA